MGLISNSKIYVKAAANVIAKKKLASKAAKEAAKAAKKAAKVPVPMAERVRAAAKKTKELTAKAKELAVSEKTLKTAKSLPAKAAKPVTTNVTPATGRDYDTLETMFLAGKDANKPITRRGLLKAGKDRAIKHTTTEVVEAAKKRVNALKESSTSWSNLDKTGPQKLSRRGFLSR
jgi:hypothetical protein